MSLTRRELFTFWRRPSEPPRRRAILPLLRPPGALAEAMFLDTCQRCGRCVEVCPRQAIQLHPGDGTPVIVPRSAPCVVCAGLECTHVCPSGALTPLSRPTDIRIGTAVVDPACCLAHHGQECHACSEVCPIPQALVQHPGDGTPVVDPRHCVGCGLCEHLCPTQPLAAIAVQPNTTA